MDPLTEFIRDQKALCEAATEGPWYDDGYRVYGPAPADLKDRRDAPCLWEYKHSPAVVGDYDETHGEGFWLKAGKCGAFAAVARTNYPLVLRMLEKLALLMHLGIIQGICKEAKEAPRPANICRACPARCPTYKHILVAEEIATLLEQAETGAEARVPTS